MSILIGITGSARAGKDSFGSHFVKYGFKRTAFANALKTATAYIANEDSTLYFGDDTKEEYTEALQTTRRMALQKVGSAVRNSLGPDTWVRRVIRAWDAQGNPPTVVTDVRYPNEARAIRERGGLIVRITRPGAGLTGEAATHESENGLPDDLVDVEIVNDGTLSELQAEAKKVAAMAGIEVSGD
jgi:hypothetical protein